MKKFFNAMTFSANFVELSPLIILICIGVIAKKPLPAESFFLGMMASSFAQDYKRKKEKYFLIFSIILAVASTAQALSYIKVFF